jgi:iron transport multicopper oxidase
VEIVVNNNDAGKHPFHLHGHAFQVIFRSEDDVGPFDPANITDLPATPMKRDTVLVRPNGHTVLRFRADNPGVWLFHCHIEWHVASGLTMTMVERPLDIQKQLSGKIPTGHLDACKAGNVPTEGNAAGNTGNLLDLTGENVSPGTLPTGFTARGIVALVFSCLAAFLGMGVIGWYGMKPIKAKTG